ncbi:MAG: hypothetical protein AAFU72_00495 [Pseudomonadota bacterium]
MRRLVCSVARRAPRALGGLCLCAGVFAAAFSAIAPPAGAQSEGGFAVDLDAVNWNDVPSDVAAYPGVPLFTMPFLKAQMDIVTLATRTGDYTTALRLIDTLTRRYPLVADFHATRAALLAAQGDVNASLAALDTALDLGFDQVARLRSSPAFKDLSSNPGFRDITARRRKPLPIEPRVVIASRVEGQTAEVQHDNTQWSQRLGRLVSRFNFPPTLADRASFDDVSEGSLTGRLAARIEAGEAAGLDGVLYDNRDRDHVTLRREQFPQLSFVEYSRAAKAAQLDYGLNLSLFFNAITIGNSSTARTGRYWRSQPRVALTEPFGPQGLAAHYLADHFYFFPEHQDHDPVSEGGKGDVFPANTPLYMVSQGSSGSEYRLMLGALYALAAMSPDTQAFLDQRNLTAPTLQMILRRAMAPVADDPEVYLTGVAHPSAFDGAALEWERVVEIAERLTPETIPPVPLLRVLSDVSAQEGTDYFGTGLNEKLFDTGFSLARVWRSKDVSREMLLVSGPNFEPGQDVITMRWVLLRGDPERVKIQPLDRRGRRAKLTVDWHDTVAVPGRDDMKSQRVDIAVFADNGLEISAPAFVSILFPAGQARDYEPDGQGGQRIARIDYRAFADDETVYDDPLIFPTRRWQDRYDYDADGKLLGWTRLHEDGARERYTASGQLVRESDPNGRPLVVESVEYPLRREGTGARVVRVEPTGRLFDYIYRDEADLRGVLSPRSVVADEGDAARGAAD